MKSPKTWFMDLDVWKKMLLCMITIALLATAIACAMFYSTMYKDYVETSNAKAITNVNTISSTLNNSFSNLFFNIFKFMDTDEFNAILTSAASGRVITQNTFANMSEQLDSLVRSNNLVDTILLIAPSKAYCSSLNIRLKNENLNVDVWEDHGGEEITWLSARETPYAVPDQYIIPLSFSISQRRGVNEIIPFLVKNKESLSLRLFIFFDYEKMKNLLQVDDQNVLGTTYIADSGYRPISLKKEAQFYNVAASESFQKACAQESAFGEIRYAGETYIVCVGNVSVSGLRVVNITNKSELLSGLSAIKNVTAVTVATTVLAAILFSAAFTQIITRPLNKLMHHVRSIGKGETHHTPFITQYNDEIGTLGKSINSMLETISEQMVTIKNEERKRSDAEIKVLTQQINPHFIYNTLDCIRWEILSKNIDGSSNMVESLAKFLRLGFGHTGDTVMITEEVTRAEQYINIMRYRLSGSIQFTSYIGPDLETFRIPKMVLQPMVENCIKHGFKNNLGAKAIVSPEIHIYAHSNGGFIYIGVEDNGTGIDIARAKASLSRTAAEEQQQEGIGLCNSYLRMRSFFGTENVSINFSTTPYYINRVEYQIKRQENG